MSSTLILRGLDRNSAAEPLFDVHVEPLFEAYAAKHRRCDETSFLHWIAMQLKIRHPDCPDEDELFKEESSDDPWHTCPKCQETFRESEE